MDDLEGLGAVDGRDDLEGLGTLVVEKGVKHKGPLMIPPARTQTRQSHGSQIVSFILSSKNWQTTFIVSFQGQSSGHGRRVVG